MGGTTFITFSYGKDVREAFQRAVKEAEHTYGHGGYTGTIAEKTKYRTIPLSEHKGKNKIKYANQLIDKDDWRIEDKYDPAGAIRITGELEKEIRKREKLKGKKSRNLDVFWLGI